MNTETTLTQSGSFIFGRLGQMKQREVAHSPPSGPAITISQRTGSGAHEIAERMAGILQRTEPNETEKWSVFDRQLVERALEEHHWPKRIAKYMPEDRRSYMRDVTDELFGLRPPSWVLVPQVVETILRLVKAGHVIVVGRGATVITSRMAGVFHVRLVAPLPNRIERVQRLHGLNRKEAARFIEREDRGSRRYVEAHFHARIEDELLYHLIINTDRIPCADAAMLIANEARRYFEGGGRLQDGLNALQPDSI
jgi:hypothetical protein